MPPAVSEVGPPKTGLDVEDVVPADCAGLAGVDLQPEGPVVQGHCDKVP